MANSCVYALKISNLGVSRASRRFYFNDFAIAFRGFPKFDDTFVGFIPIDFRSFVSAQEKI